VIDLREGRLAESSTEGILRPVDASLAPVSHASREVEQEGGEDLARRLGATGEIPVGGAILTPAGPLAASFLIHVAVQAPEEPVSEVGIRRALRNGLRRAVEWELESLSLPPLGTGAGNLEPEASARLMVDILREHMETEVHPSAVTIVVPGPYEFETFSSALARRPTAGRPDPSGEPAAG
jgi:O-acetyl-ADP-ribose deacetylase (regulator of RNase III)